MQPLRVTMPKTTREEGRRCAARRRAPFINLLAVRSTVSWPFHQFAAPPQQPCTAALAFHAKEKRRLDFRSSKGGTKAGV